MTYVRILAGVGLLLSIAWLIAQPGYAPGLAIITSALTLISTFVVQRKSVRRAQQHQSVSKSSVGIQAGGDVTVGAIAGDKHAK